MQYNGYRDLKVYKLAYKLAMEVFAITKTFPKEEKYSLVDQIRRSSRSVPVNIAEAWRRRIYTKMFITRIIDSFSEAGETEVWLDFSRDAGYINDENTSHAFHTWENGPYHRVQICHSNNWDATHTCVGVLLRGVLWLEFYEAYLRNGGDIDKYCG